MASLATERSEHRFHVGCRRCAGEPLLSAPAARVRAGVQAARGGQGEPEFAHAPQAKFVACKAEWAEPEKLGKKRGVDFSGRRFHAPSAIAAPVPVYASSEML